TLDDALLLEIDCDGAAGARHAEPLGEPIDRNDLLRAEQDGAADRHLADRAGAPDGHGVSRFDVTLDRRLPSGRENVAEEQYLLVLDTVRDLDRRDIGVGNADIFGLAAGITARQVRIAKEPGGGVPEHFVGEVLVAVGALADREIAALALVALAANDRERHDDAVANLKLLVLGSDLDNFAHEFVAHDVAGLHPGHEAVIEVQVGAADCGARD